MTSIICNFHHVEWFFCLLSLAVFLSIPPTLSIFRHAVAIRGGRGCDDVYDKGVLRGLRGRSRRKSERMKEGEVEEEGAVGVVHGVYFKLVSSRIIRYTMSQYRPPARSFFTLALDIREMRSVGKMIYRQKERGRKGERENIVIITCGKGCICLFKYIIINVLSLFLCVCVRAGEIFRDRVHIYAYNIFTLHDRTNYNNNV